MEYIDISIIMVDKSDLRLWNMNFAHAKLHIKGLANYACYLQGRMCDICAIRIAQTYNIFEKFVFCLTKTKSY